MKYKYFLFDWDGSLGASLPIWFEAFREAFKSHGVEITDLEIGREVIGDWDGPKKFGVHDVDSFFKYIENLILEKLNNVKLNDGAADLIEKIKKNGGKIAVVTTSKRKYVEIALQKTGIINKVDVFLGKENVSKYKPDPEMLFRALELMGGEVVEAVMIGDTVKDIEAAKRAGMDSVLYYPREYRAYYEEQKQRQLGATYVVDSFSNIENIIF